MCVYARIYVCTRFQVNYSIIAVDILLFVAVVGRRPAAESGSRREFLRCRASFSSPRLPISVAVAVATVIFTARVRDSRDPLSIDLHGKLTYSLEHSMSDI